MPDLDLGAIRARVEAATPGTWEASNGTVTTDADDHFWIAPTVFADEDAEFIAHAREDVPALLGEIERLHAGIRKLIDANDWPKCREQLEELGPDFRAADEDDQQDLDLIRGVVAIMDTLRELIGESA